MTLIDSSPLPSHFPRWNLPESSQMVAAGYGGKVFWFLGAFQSGHGTRMFQKDTPGNRYGKVCNTAFTAVKKKLTSYWKLSDTLKIRISESYFHKGTTSDPDERKNIIVNEMGYSLLDNPYHSSHHPTPFHKTKHISNIEFTGRHFEIAISYK